MLHFDRILLAVVLVLLLVFSLSTSFGGGGLAASQSEAGATKAFGLSIPTGGATTTTDGASLTASPPLGFLSAVRAVWSSLPIGRLLAFE
jgi:hypothetical protein